MGFAWVGVVVIAGALGWLYFSAKLRTLRLRVPPRPAPHTPDPGGIDRASPDAGPAQRQVPLPESSYGGSPSAVRNEKS